MDLPGSVQYLPLSFQVVKETAKPAMEVQTSGVSWDSGEEVLEEVGAEKPETRQECLSSQAEATYKDRQPVTTRR